MDQSNLTLCYEGVQRVYRNAIVGYIRSRIQDAHPDSYVDVLRKPFKKEEWLNIEASARERRHTGEVASSIRDDFDLLGVNHFFNIFDACFDDLCPAKGGWRIRSEVWDVCGNSVIMQASELTCFLEVDRTF